MSRLQDGPLPHALAAIAGQRVTGKPVTPATAEATIDYLRAAPMCALDLEQHKIGVPAFLPGLDAPATFLVRMPEHPPRFTPVDYPPISESAVVPWKIERVESDSQGGIKIATERSGSAWLLAGLWDNVGRPVADRTAFDAAWIKSRNPVGDDRSLRIVRISHDDVHVRFSTHHTVERQHEVLCVIDRGRIRSIIEHEEQSDTWRINFASSDLIREDGVPTSIMIHAWIGAMTAREPYSNQSGRSWNRDDVIGLLRAHREKIPYILSAPLLTANQCSEPSLLEAMQNRHPAWINSDRIVFRTPQPSGPLDNMSVTKMDWDKG